MAWKDRLAGRSGQQVLTGANFALYSLIVIALIVLVNWFVNNHDKRWDMTPTKKYSLSEQTHKILKELNRDVTIYAFDQERNFGERRDVLGMYASASNHLKVKYVDPNRQPALAKEYSVRSFGTVVVSAGDRHMEAQGDGEEGITNALVRVLKGQRTACFIQTHGERNLDSTERDGYDHFKKQLSNENYQTETLPFLQKMEIPKDCTMAIIAGPQNDYLPPEIDVIHKYLQDGGRALIMLDAGVELPNLTKLLGDWGVTARNDLVIDENPVAQIFGTEPYMPLIVKYGNSPIVQPLNGRATLFPLSRSFEVGKDSKPGVSADSLGDTSADSYDVTDWNPTIKEIQFHAGKDLKGPLTVGVAGSVSGGGEKKAEGRFVALGTSLIAANSFLNFQSNRDFIMNSINWLSADEDLISIRATPPESQHLNMNAEQMRRVLILGVFGIPILIVLAGVLVWWQRR
ncbi:MAG: GldG family protein [Terriglobia bacterium]|jgi:ABC-type uncharacterized transport system involved in gliding motility auxiliary subunit